jgi:hypothetical protein
MRARDHQLEDGWIEARARPEAGRRQRPVLRGPEAVVQQESRGGHLGGKRKKGEGVEDRKGGTTEEQRALYTRARRRGGALPDREELNPKWQRTGSDSTQLRKSRQESRPVFRSWAEVGGKLCQDRSQINLLGDI